MQQIHPLTASLQVKPSIMFLKKPYFCFSNLSSRVDEHVFEPYLPYFQFLNLPQFCQSNNKVNKVGDEEDPLVTKVKNKNENKVFVHNKKPYFSYEKPYQKIDNLLSI